MELGNTAVRQLERNFNVPIQIMESEYGVDESVESCSREDKLCVCGDGFLLTEALRTAQECPDIRQSKVDALKARIAAGEYEPDPFAIASALVREDGAIFA